MARASEVNFILAAVAVLLFASLVLHAALFEHEHPGAAVGAEEGIAAALHANDKRHLSLAAYYESDASAAVLLGNAERTPPAHAAARAALSRLFDPVLQGLTDGVLHAKIGLSFAGLSIQYST